MSVKSINEPGTPAHTEHAEGLRDEKGNLVKKPEQPKAEHKDDDGGDDDRHGRRRHR